MTFFSDEERASLEIERMVFHLVGPSEEQFVRLEALEPGRFADFFLDRIRSVEGGAAYRFSDASATRERLSRIDADLELFQEESERLAGDFQRKHGGGAAAGAFLVFTVRAGDVRLFALLKYDDEVVLTYEVEETAEGRKRVTLDALERTFVQNRNALQKAALIRLAEGGGELVVSDRQNPQKVARYFEGFLDATRVHADVDLTATLVGVTRELIRSNPDLVGPEVHRERTRRTFDAARAGGQIAGDNQKAYLESVVGRPLADDEPLAVKYRGALRKARIEDHPITLDPAKVAPPRTRRLVTDKNIQIRIPLDVEQFVTVEANRIIINDRVADQSDDTEIGR